MIIHQPEIIRKNSEIILLAKIEYAHTQINLPDSCWFAFPEDYEPYLTSRSDPFAVAMIQTSQYLGENLEIRGELSERLAYGLHQYGSIFHLWNPKWFDPPHLAFDKLVQPIAPANRLVMTAFSGGVDSFYTLQCHLPENQPIPSYQLQAGLFIHGMDIRFYEADDYRRAYSTFQKMFTQLGLQLFQARINGYFFWEHRLRWEYVHGGQLIATALCFSEKINRFYIPSTHCYNYLLHNGTSPITDHWLSTETVDIVHHGSEKNRFEKLEKISLWELPQNYLRVCTDALKRDGINNCSQCNKCLRTMIILDQIGALDNFKTFNRKISAQGWIKYIITAPGPTYPSFIFNYARKNKQFGAMILAWLAIQFGKAHRIFSEDIVNLLSKEQLYKLKHRVYAKYSEHAQE